MEDPNQPQPPQGPGPSQGPGGQPPPQAQPPPPGQGAPEGPKTGQPPLSIIALVTGILGILTFWCCLIGWPASIAAIITGILGRKQAPERGVSPTMATVGLALGIVTIVLSIGWLAFAGFSTDFNSDFDTS